MTDTLPKMSGDPDEQDAEDRKAEALEQRSRMAEAAEKKDRAQSLMPALIFGIAFIIGCYLLYLAMDDYVGNSFDADRYVISKVNTANGDSLALWKLDKRAGVLEFCGKTSDLSAQVVCLRAENYDATKYTKPLQLERIAVQPATAHQ